MGRQPITNGPRKGTKQLNATVPAQLAFRFNRLAIDEGPGTRDQLVAEALEAFLDVREAAARATEELRQSEHVGKQARRGALRLAEDHARAIVEIAEVLVGRRKGPKALRPPQRAKRA